MRIFLYAFAEAKLRRLRAEGMSQEEAEEAVQTLDTERAAFIEKHFHLQWPTRSTYHAMLNTALGVETVIHSLLTLKEALPTVPSSPFSEGG